MQLLAGEDVSPAAGGKLEVGVVPGGPDGRRREDVAAAEVCTTVLSRLERQVGAGEGLGPPGAQGESSLDQEQLDRLALGSRPGAQLRECLPAAVPIDRPAIVRVDEGERPQLVALVDVRHTRSRELEQRLA